jgi:hypothetical protein
MLSTEAGALAFAFEAGAVSVADIQSWADQHILAEDQPNDLLLDLSTESNRAQALSLLHRLADGADGADKAECSRLTLGYIRRAISAGAIGYRSAADLVARMATLGYIPEVEAESQMYFFAEDLALIDVGLLALDFDVRIKEDFDAFLERYAV